MSLDFFSILSQRRNETPNRTAYTFLTNSSQSIGFTYEQLFNEVAPVASHLRSLSNQEPIILLFSPGLSFIKALYGCLCSGNIAVPVAIPKPAQKEVFLKIIENSGARYILSDPLLQKKYSHIYDDIDWIDIDQVSNKDQLHLPNPSPEDTAMLQYTSGSTGNPKGVMVSYQNLQHNLEAIRDHFGIRKESVSFSWLPHYHDMGLIDGILQPLVSGCKSLLTAPKQVIGRPEFWLDCITKYGITHTGGPNFFYEICLEKIDVDKDWDLNSIEDLYVSAEPVRIDTLRRFADRFGPFGFSMEKFTPGFGLAEATLMVTCKKANTHVVSKKFDLESYQLEAVSQGKPISGMDVVIVDPDTLQECKEGESGEIWLRGKSVTRGYWKNERQTKDTFLAQINDSGNYYLRTGDLGIIENDELYVVGRLKDTVIQNGHNFHAEDIEYAIILSHPHFRKDACVVFSVENGNKEDMVILIRLPSSKLRIDLDEMELAIRKTLFQQFGLSIASIYFLSGVGVSFAKTTSGKIRRSENKAMFISNKFNIIATSEL